MHTDKKFPEPQAFETEPRPEIGMVQVESNQIACIGHCAATNTLAVQFTRGAMAIYHYPEVSPETHAAFMAADSKGGFFKDHIKDLPFKKYPAPAGPGMKPTPAGLDAPWPRGLAPNPNHQEKTTA